MHDSGRYPVGIMHDKPTTNFAFSHGLVMAGVRHWFSMLSIYIDSHVGYFYIAFLGRPVIAFT